MQQQRQTEQTSLESVEVFWVIWNTFSLTKPSPWIHRSKAVEGEPLQTHNRTYQVALLLPHAGGADHVILFPSPVSKATEEIVRQKPTDRVSNDVDVDGLVSSKPNMGHTNRACYNSSLLQQVRPVGTHCSPRST